MNNNFKNRQKSQLFQIISITFISLITCLLFSIFTLATANSSSLTPNCDDNQSCIFIAQAEENVEKIITPASQQAELIKEARTFLGLIIVVMIVNLICMLYARQILNFLKPTVLQVLGLVLGIIQLALAINYIFGAIDLQVLSINAILNS